MAKSKMGNALKRIGKGIVIGSLAAVLSIELGLAVTDCAADISGANKKYSKSIPSIIKEEEEIFSIQFYSYPEAKVGHGHLRNEFRRIYFEGYNRAGLCKNIFSEALCHIYSHIDATKSILNFTDSVAGLESKGKIFFPSAMSSKFSKFDELVVSHELIHAYISQKHPDFMEPDGNNTPTKQILVRLTVNEGLATYASLKMLKEKYPEMAILAEEVKLECVLKCSLSMSIGNKYCQYAWGNNFVNYTLDKLGQPYNINLIIENPPNTLEELLNPEIYIQKKAK